MIGKALELRHQCAQIACAGRHADPAGRLSCQGECERVGNRAVAGRAARQTRGLVEWSTGHQRVDALVHIAEPLLQPHDRLTIGGETEVPGLDNSCMNRTNRNLVEVVTLDRQEAVSRPQRRSTTAVRYKRMPDVPEAEIEPWARIGQSYSFDAMKILERTLQADGRRVPGPDRRETAACTREA